MNILIVDDNPKDTERLNRWLGDKADAIEICSSGKEADAILAEKGSEFNLALVSWDMEGAHNGRELIARHRKNLSELRFVVMSHSLTAGIATLAHRLGVTDFLEKPLDSDEVAACVNSLIATEQPEIPFLAEMQCEIVGESKSLMDTLRLVSRAILAPKINVLIIGEPGTGKELIAQAIHRLGTAAKGRIISVHLGSIPSGLVADAIFGHEPGAFDGAKTRRKGCLEEADKGTLFLDEVGELPMQVQVELLRALQERKFQRLGANSETAFDTRLVCATNRDLATAVRAGTFRSDFYHRIRGLTIHLPPLRERRGDVPILLDHFLERARGQRQVSFARSTLSILTSYPYPGNIRELEKMVGEALTKCDGDRILPHHLNLKDMGTLLEPEAEDAIIPNTAQPEVPTPPAETETIQLPFPASWLKLPLREAERKIIEAFNLVYLTPLQNEHRYNKSRMAEVAGIDRKTLDQHLKKAGLEVKKHSGALPQQSPNDQPK
ncbi:MAG: sigma-54 dependent transcriptional regulator [Acidobacteriota bacterium]